MNVRQALLGAAVLAVALTVLLIALLGWRLADPGPAADLAREPISPPPAASDEPAAPKVAPRHVFRPPPADEPPPTATAPVDATDGPAIARAELNDSESAYYDTLTAMVMHALVTDCIQPWMARTGATEPFEAEWELVVGHDGLEEIALVGGDVDEELDDCITEQAWAHPWPRIAKEGTMTTVSKFAIDPPKGPAPSEEALAESKRRNLETSGALATIPFEGELLLPPQPY